MNFKPHQLYHFYNRGNNSQNIFFKEDNYIQFLKKVKKHLLPYSDILAWCLMPNHFHFLLYTNEKVVDVISTTLNGVKKTNPLSESIRIMLSSYSKLINSQENRTGSIFQQNSKAKNISEIEESENKTNQDYLFNCFNYIHQNPLQSDLVNLMEKWDFSSFKDYIGNRNGSLCNKKLANELIELPQNQTDFYNISYEIIDKEKEKYIL